MGRVRRGARASPEPEPACGVPWRPMQEDRRYVCRYARRRYECDPRLRVCGAMGMTRGTLVRRLERLETRWAPEGAPLVIRFIIVDPDGTRSEGPKLVIPGAGGSHHPSRGRAGGKAMKRTGSKPA